MNTNNVLMNINTNRICVIWTHRFGSVLYRRIIMEKIDVTIIIL